jgi:transposase
MPSVPVKLNATYDTAKKKFVAAKVRVKPAHDTKDAGYLIKQSKAKKAVADKGYTKEQLHQLADEQGTILLVPLKKNIKRGRYRKKHQASFNIKTYHRRELVKASFSSIKRKMGSSVSAKKARTIRTEVLCRLACHNITGKKKSRFRTKPERI